MELVTECGNMLKELTISMKKPKKNANNLNALYIHQRKIMSKLIFWKYLITFYSSDQKVYVVLKQNGNFEFLYIDSVHIFNFQEIILNFIKQQRR